MSTQDVRETDDYDEAKQRVSEVVSNTPGLHPTEVNEFLDEYSRDQVRESIWDLIHEGEIELEGGLTLAPDDGLNTEWSLFENQEERP